MMSPRFPNYQRGSFADDTIIHGEVSEDNYDLDLNHIEIWMVNKFMMKQDKNKKVVFSLKKKIDKFLRECTKNRNYCCSFRSSN